MRSWKIALCLAAIAGVTLAAGNSATATWTAPTVYTDGSALPAGDIDHYTLTWAPATGQSGASGSVNTTATTAVVNVPCGSTSFTVSVTTTPTAKYPSVTSSPTSPVPYATGIACTVNPPGALAVH